MKQVAEKLQEVISQEIKVTDDKKSKEFKQFLSEMKKAGLIKETNYNLPMVDTIGKTYYSTINKHEG